MKQKKDGFGQEGPVTEYVEDVNTGDIGDGSENVDVPGETKSQRFNRIARAKLLGIVTQVKKLKTSDAPNFDNLCSRIIEVKEFFLNPQSGNKKIEKLNKSIDGLKNLANPQVYEYNLDSIAENLDLLLRQVKKVETEFNATESEEEKIFHF